MFVDEDLIEHLNQQQAIKTESLVFLELNQNDATNVETLGVFKWGEVQNESIFKQWQPLPQEFYYKYDFYTSYMKKDVLDEEIIHFGARRDKSEYFNLADCFTEFRPRSGILKAVMPKLKNQVFVDNFRSVNRPRYYIPSINDNFKYWTSWVKDENGNEIGLSDGDTGAIKNAAPFVVYKEARPANKVTVKIQTGIGDSIKRTSTNPDPLIDVTRSTIPKEWMIQYLDTAGTWQDIYVFSAYDKKIPPANSGTIDFGYFIRNPIGVKGYDFTFRGYLPTPAHLPMIGRNGEAYSIGADTMTLGRLHIYDDTSDSPTGWKDYGPVEREWQIIDPDKNPENYAVTGYVNPTYYNPTAPVTIPAHPPFGEQKQQDGFNYFAEFVMMQGIRIVVTKMHAVSRSFDLIELSPRLFVNISDSVIEYTVDKAIAEDSPNPVGSLSASTGFINIDNSKLMFNSENKFNHQTGKGSLIADRLNRNTKVLFYDIVREVKKGGFLYDYLIPVKTLYVVEKPVVVSGDIEATMNLRDLVFRFEEAQCPNIVLKQCSISKAVATLLDSVGFSNYIFNMPNSTIKTQSANKTIIPFFFVTETMTIAEALTALAQASQCAMFFDEYNNFVVMPREHFGADPSYILRGQTTIGGQANIEEITAAALDMAGDATVEYTIRQLARQAYGPTSLGLQNSDATKAGQYAMGEEGTFMGYKQSILWNAEDVGNVTLSAAALESPLSDQRPQYNPAVPDSFTNIAINVGFSAIKMPFEGMVMMNGEIIKYDAKQVSTGGNPVWISSEEDYDELIGNSPFPSTTGFDQVGTYTGLLRIWTDLEKDENNTIKLIRDGRGMYGTTPVYHEAASLYWMTPDAYIHKDTALKTVFDQQRDKYLDKYDFALLPSPAETVSTTRVSNYIYNPVHSTFSFLHANPLDLQVPTITPDTPQGRRINPLLNKIAIRSSSIVFGGESTAGPDMIYKKSKTLDGNAYSTFGCRMGIIGSSKVSDIEGSEKDSTDQSPANAMVYATTQISTETDGPEESKVVMGSGGGIFLRTSRTWNNTSASNDGYYFEITALNGEYDDQPGEGFSDQYVFPNVNFYKINGGTPKAGIPEADAPRGNIAIPLFSAFMPIGVTHGSQLNRSRIFEAVYQVYDLAIDIKQEPLEQGIYSVFYLYINDVLIARVVDSPRSSRGYTPIMPPTTEVGFFVRGRSEIQLEHIYAIGGGINDRAVEINDQLDTSIFRRLPEFKVFSPSAIWTTQALSGGPDNGYRYYDEFGTIAREVRKVDVKYNVFPAFLPSFQKMRLIDRGYAVTHFAANPYSASFMLWSEADELMKFGTDVAIQLVIQGLSFADNQPEKLLLDDYLIGRAPGQGPQDKLNSGLARRNKLLAIRAMGQTSTIELSSIYIQSTDFAKKLMNWLDGFIGEERLRIEVKAFGTPHLQIGDMVTIDYDIPYMNEGELEETHNWNPTKPDYINNYLKFYGVGKRFVIRKIGIDVSIDGPEYNLSLVEAPSKASWNAGDW